MLLSLSLIIISSFILSEICIKLRIPKIIGMMLAGVILGPFVLDLIAPDILNISSDLRQIALIIILLRAGLSLNIKDLKVVGKNAILLSFLPATFEIIATMIFAPLLLDFTLLEAALLGSILAAVSPAVVVPKMLLLMEEKRGTKKSIPQMIMAGASVDDVYVIVLFTSILAMAKSGENFSFVNFIQLPIAILSGILSGVALGVLLVWLFKKYHLRDTSKVLLILSTGLFLLTIEKLEFIPFSGLLATLSLGVTILAKYEILAKRLVIKYEKIWVFSEILLFVLIGAAVDIKSLPSLLIISASLILILLSFRAVGVLISTRSKNINLKERTFAVFAYLPKATVQASIAAIPLSEGISKGNIILTIAVISIFITAPLGSFLIDLTKKKLLEDNNIDQPNII